MFCIAGCISITVNSRYLIKESKNTKTIRMLEGFGEIPVLLVPVDDMHLKGQSHVVEGVLRTTIVFVPPMKVQAFDFILVVKRATEYIRETEAFLFFLRTVFRDG